jgi:hypothetical protein
MGICDVYRFDFTSDLGIFIDVWCRNPTSSQIFCLQYFTIKIQISISGRHISISYKWLIVVTEVGGVVVRGSR